jgi:hypothetical protein
MIPQVAAGDAVDRWRPSDSARWVSIVAHTPRQPVKIAFPPTGRYLGDLSGFSSDAVPRASSKY